MACPTLCIIVIAADLCMLLQMLCQRLVALCGLLLENFKETQTLVSSDGFLFVLQPFQVSLMRRSANYCPLTSEGGTGIGCRLAMKN